MDGLFKTDDGAALRFYYGTEKNNFQSERNGRGLFDKILYVEVITPGSKESCPVFALERTYCDEAKQKAPWRDEVRCAQFARQIEAFKSQVGDKDLIGTPIEEWPAVDIHVAEMLRAAKVYTVEALASISDGNLNALGMGARSLRERAQVFLETARGNAPTEALAADNVRLKEELEALSKRVEEMGNNTALAAENETLRAEIAALKERNDKLDGIDKEAPKGGAKKTTV